MAGTEVEGRFSGAEAEEGIACGSQAKFEPSSKGEADVPAVLSQT